MDALLATDIREVLGKGPMTVSGLIESLRHSMFSAREVPSGRRWRNFRQGEFERELSREGFVLRCRKHGSGYATYVGLVPFAEVWDGRRKMVAVRECGWL